MNYLPKILFTFSICVIFTFQAFSQSMSWRDHAKLGEEAYTNGQFEDAADHFQNVWQLKNKKTQYLYRAAETYYLIREFKKAAAAYIHLKDNKKDYPTAGLAFAKSLKQYGNYEEAGIAFKNYMDTNQGSSAEALEEIEREIKGCDLAIAQKATTSFTEIEHMSEAINSPKAEFAPIPVGENIIYFSSTRKAGKAKIYYSQVKNGEWTAAAMPTKLPRIRGEHYGNGTLTPDNDRFYFTICSSITAEEGLRSRCEINVIKKEGEGWTKPEKLGDYINLPEYTTTHPNVVHIDGKEILYFSSDREGGYGGMDIWFVSREIAGNDIDFSFPKNVGSRINTNLDEITPYYNKDEESLYFSSNGLIGVGGQDIFKANGSEAFWDRPVNMEIPINSSTDDYFFIKKADNKTGYLVSNRIFGDSKIKTTDEDIFMFDMKDPPLALQAKGRIMEEGNMTMIDNATLALHEIDQEGHTNMVDLTNSKEGFYDITIFPSKEYRFLIEKPGYENLEISFNTYGENGNKNFEQDIFLEKTINVVEETIATTETPVEEKEVIAEATTTQEEVVIDNALPAEEVAIAVTEEEVAGAELLPEEVAVMEETTDPVIEEVQPEADNSIEETVAVVEETAAPVVEENTILESTTQEEDITDEVIAVMEDELTIKGNATEESTVQESSDMENTAITASANTIEDTNAPKEVKRYKIYTMSNMDNQPAIATASTSSAGTNYKSEFFDGNSSGGNIYNSVVSYESNNPSMMDIDGDAETYKTDYYPYYTVTSKAAKHVGEYYKVQFVALKNSPQKDFSRLLDLGKMETEYINDKGLTRYMISTFFTKDEARIILQDIKNRGYDDAFLAKYIDGKRTIDIFR